MLSGAALKAIGVLTAVVGLGLDLVSDYVNDQEMKQAVRETVDEALAEHSDEN